MENLKYEELKEIRRGLGIFFLLVATFFADLLKDFVLKENPSSKEILFLELTFVFLIVIFSGIILITGIIWT